jgi:Tfp pilus assembly protein PilF
MPHTIVFVVAWIGIIGSLVTGCSKDPTALKANHLERAERYTADGKYPEAVIEYRNAIQIDPNDANTQYKLGLAYLNQHAVTNVRPAFTALSKAVELDPNLLDAQVKLGELYFLGRQFNNADEKAKLVLEKDPTYRDALLLLANSAMAQNRFDRAEGAITSARQAHPNDPAVVCPGRFGHGPEGLRRSGTRAR